MLPSIYAYSEPVPYLRDVLANKQTHNRFFSIRAWSKQMGFQCHTSLVLFLNEKRKIKIEHVENLNRSLRLDGDESKYLRLMIQKQSAKTEKDREHFAREMRTLQPSKEQSELELEKFRLVADWVHMAILEMTQLQDFKNDPAWISDRLAFEVPTTVIAGAIERLMKLGLLIEQEGQLTKTSGRLTTPKDRAGESIREHHSQVLRNAAIAIHEQGVHERVLNSCTMTIDTARLPEAKELILKFRADMAKLLEKKGGDETYQLSVQFFKLTEILPSPNEVQT